MAEAAVEDRPPQKFYCHMCNVQFQNASANFTCPHCSDGFIEELQDPPANNEEMVDVNDWVDDDVMDDLITLPLHLVDERRTGRPRSDGNRTGRRTLTRLASSNLRQQVPFENLLQDFIVNLGVGVNWGTSGNMQLFLGNPGDYAWGREGLDAIVTQLLNQMDSTGPPPVSKDVIDALPIVEVTPEQVTAKLQCSVCWEDFLSKENVRQLPCLHIYHEPCIRPWLELHGTCPICRQNLVNGEQSSSDNNPDLGGTSSAIPKMDQDIDQHLREIQSEYLDFLDDGEDQGKYTQLVKNMVADNSRRLVININDLRRKNPVRATALLNNAFEEQVAFQKALKDFVFTVSTDYAKDKDDFFIAFEGSFGNKHVSPRTLTSRYLGNLICVEGIVTKCSLIHPKVVRSVHFCPATKKVMERKYTDLTSLDAFPSYAVYPTKDDEGNSLETEFGLSTYKDHQTISIQEMPEKAPAGQLPRSVDIVCDNDLVDMCKPGDRIQVVGNFRCLPNKQGSFTNGTFRTIVIANNITQLSKEANPAISREDVSRCKNLAKTNKNVFNLLAKSLAPSIHGHEYIKKAILCLLLGGVEKVLPNGTRLRGDINILLIGDPSVAKSQLLRYVLSTAPRAIATTGRGSSGVGLTAAVTTDQETGERRLEAGAMVLADRGVVCIDEFDKMSDIDRTAIHEVMEQGRVTIAKAGIHASLNARCSVLAAANPVYGKYDQYKTPMENIGLQDSLLSRFDCLFVMLDTIDEDQDLKISDHVVRMHRYRNPLEQDGEVLPMGSNVDMLSTMNPDEEEGKKETPMYEKYDALLHGTNRKRTDKILSVDFMRKYIHFVKILKPALTEEASEIISDEYSRLRSEDVLDNDVARTQPVTPRTLETMIRLSTAHAKARMSRTVAAEDAHAAIELVQFAYFKKVLEKEKKRRKRGNESEDDDDDDEQRPKRSRRRSTVGDATDDELRSTQGSTRSGETLRTTEEEPLAEELPLSGVNGLNGHSQEESMEVDDSPHEITLERLSLFKSGLQRTFRENRAQSLALSRIRESVNSDNASPFTQGEIHAAIERMTDDNQVMLADGILFLI